MQPFCNWGYSILRSFDCWQYDFYLWKISDIFSQRSTGVPNEDFRGTGDANEWEFLTVGYVVFCKPSRKSTKSWGSIVCSSSDNSSTTENQTFIQNRLVFPNNNQMFGGGFDDIFVDISRELTHRIRTQMFRKCRRKTCDFYSMPKLDNFIFFQFIASFEIVKSL